MNAPIDNRRRRFIAGAAALAGTGTLAGLLSWIPAGAAAGNRDMPSGPVTIVVFDAHGTRVGQRSVERVVHSAAEWKARLTAAQYHVLRQAGTERRFSGKYVDPPRQAGLYHCQGCGTALYDAATQFHSGTGWPSFYQPIAAANVREFRDASLGMIRTEVRCSRCNGHLGHKFHDGPQPTGLRYCMNSVALDFVATGRA